MREEAKVKRQLCGDVVLHQDEVDGFEIECNAKETPTVIRSENVVTCIQNVTCISQNNFQN